VNPALLFLVRRSFVNGLRSKLARLKSPRYLVPFLIGLAYFGLVFGRWGNDDRGPVQVPGMAREPGPDLGALWEWGLGAGAFLMAAAAWVFPSRGPPLHFLESEVALLFPAPLSRKELVQFKLLDVQRYLLLSMLFFGLFSAFRSGAARGLQVLLTGWLALNALTLHQVGAKFTRQGLLDHGWSGLRRHAAPVILILGIPLFAVLSAPPFPALGQDDALRGVARWLEALGDSPAGWAFYPFRMLVRPGLAPDLASALVPLLGVLFLNGALYWWVMRADVAFEESAADHAKELTRRIEAIRAGKGLSAAAAAGKPARRSAWRLSAAGPPETAFLWKSVSETLRGVSPRLVFLLLMGGMMGVIVAGRGSPGRGGVVPGLLAAGMLFVAGLLVFMGPSLLGSNLRGDLVNVEALKTLPLTGARLVRSSLLGAAAPTAAVQALLVVFGAALLPDPREQEITAAFRIGGAVAAAALLASVTTLSAAADAAAVLWFPAWMKPGQAVAQGGVEGMGYGIVVSLGKVLVLVLGSILPGALGAALVLGAFAALGPVALPSAILLGGLVAAAGMLAEVWVLTEAMGLRFERLDPAAEGIVP
jgi:hypothetical protein